MCYPVACVDLPAPTKSRRRDRTPLPVARDGKGNVVTRVSFVCHNQLLSFLSRDGLLSKQSVKRAKMESKHVAGLDNLSYVLCELRSQNVSL